MTQPVYHTEIIQEPNEDETGYEYDMYVEDQYIGCRPTRAAAQQAIDEHVHRRLRHAQPAPVAAPSEVCGVSLAHLEEEAQRRSELLTAESHSETPDDAAHARRRINALNKAVMHALEGTSVRESLGDYLIASGTRGGVVHRVSSRYGCSCEAGQKNQPCWHNELADLLYACREQQMESAA